ncbi:MAG: endolytic transglycosylase MltG [Candidatus Taylorbacteria bacterium]|nr:endolytic transglycosylase MltG [Candidatus Taylorbacteria bacterium]
MIKQRVIRKSKNQKKPLPKLYFFLAILTFATFIGSSAHIFMAGNPDNFVSFYSNLANPYMKYVYISPGLRREEVAHTFQKALSWSPTQVREFLEAAPKDDRGSLDGYYMPGKYWVEKGATGKAVAKQMIDNFNNTVSKKVIASKGTNPFNQKINIDTAVRIASIIQREAAGKHDMRLISGIIWNRMFKGMKLEMDATLQYAKASSTDWWPMVQGKDKYIDSPFNTYQNKGLPPIAIANPGLDAILAAINPQKTDCLFYIHDKNRNIHCEKEYSEHKANVEKYLIGRK